MEEKLFEAIGNFGRWQKVIFAIFFYCNLVGIWQNYAMTFQAINVPFRCIEPFTNTSIDDDGQWSNECTVRLPNASDEVSCTRWEYDTVKHSNTLVSQFDLVCDREWIISFAKSIYMIGFLLSAFVCGQLSDWIGRRPTILIWYTIACLSFILSLFSKSIETFLIFRCLQAFGRTGLSCLGYVLIMEITGPMNRSFVGIFIQVGWSFGLCFLVAIGYIFKDWFWFQVALTVSMLPLVVVFILVPESPRWLIMHGRSEHLKKLITCASKRNRIELKEDVSKIVEKLIEGRRVERKGTLLDLFRTPNLRCRILIVMYLWVVNGFVYYALSFNTNDLFGDPYINFLLLGILEFPSLGMLFFFLRWTGRRTAAVSLMFLSGICCISLIAVPNDLPWMTTILSQAGKFCVTASFGLLYLYTGELFPTVVRSVAFGSCSTVSRIGSILAPFTRELGRFTHASVPNIVICILGVSSGILAFWLPETAGHKLLDTLYEGENTFERKPVNKCHGLEEKGT